MRNWKFKDSDFSDFPVYEGNDLGVLWTPGSTCVKIWAPNAKQVFFRLYKTGQGGEAIKEILLLPDDQGIWMYEIMENLEGLFYTLQIMDGQGWLREGPDIYAKATGVNGTRGMIIDFQKSNPAKWETDIRRTFANATDLVIYEVHIRDFSMSPSSGIKNKGKYLGFYRKGY